MKLFATILVALAVSCVAQDLLLSDDIVNAVNSNPKSTWTAGRNSFFEGWDMGKGIKYMGALEDKTLDQIPRRKHAAFALPTSFDAREQWKGCIGPILNQADCGSCWAFGCAEAVSDRLCISKMAAEGNATFLQLAPLDLVACDSGMFGNSGCRGGQLSTAWQYVKDYGLVTESCSPYLTTEGGPIPTCPPTQQPCLNFVNTPSCNKTCADGSSWTGDKHHIQSVYSVSGADQIAAEIMQNGPVEAAFTVYQDFVHYKSGVYQHTTGPALGGHAIKIIGWGTEGGVDYWLVANSWTTTWGADGLFKIARGVDECGIEDDVVAGTV